MDAGLFLDDFEAEARSHIEKIETAFLDIDALSDNPDLINSLFRTAHSLKGTAGFFSLDKIVTVAHELESVFSQVKDGSLAITEEITDIVLQCVDYLKDLVDNIRSEDIVDTKNLVETLKTYSVADPKKSDENAEKIAMPFDCGDQETKKELKNAARHGHKIYYVNIGFNRSLGKYYKRPDGMIDNILSIGNILEAVVNGDVSKIIKDAAPAGLTKKITDALAECDTSTLELLVTSVLELELFSIAIEIDKKNIRLLPKEIASQGEESEKPEKPVKSERPAKYEKSKAGPEPRQKSGPAKTEEPAEHERAYRSSPARETSFSIRLDVSSINNLMDLANEMILTRNQLLSAVSGYKKSIAGLTPILHDMNRLTSEIQEKVMLTRMQPINVIFGKFPRIIRDTAKALNKDIQIEILGGDVTLDKYLLDALTDPITQLVKNSADHGLEHAERRAELDKPPKGKITLNAYTRDGSAIIEVTDDGSGIDLDSLKLKCIERGIANEEELSAMSKNDVFALIFEPGISTAKRVTNLSGRGVGMDIVRTNIEKLGGSIEIDSEVDIGTTIRLKMPLTLSVIRTLIVTIDSVQYAAPEINVERIVRIWKDTPSRRLEKINKSLVLSLNGRIIPVVTMNEIDAKARGREPPSGEAEILLERSRRGDVVKCLVLRAGDRTFALLIDDAVETEETLVKALPVYLQSCLCYSNVTVLGNGNAITILDAEGILRLMGIEAAEKNIADEKIIKDTADEKQVIVFKCSGKEYFALETSEISRIETVSPANFQEIGENRFINLAGETVRIIRPEDFAPVKKRDYAEEKLYLLTLKKSASPIGLLVGKVLDKVEKAFKLDTDRLYSDFIFGTSVFNEKILIFLNPTAIAEEVEKDNLLRKNIKK